MRGGSKRLPNKNVREFFGRPIFLYTLEYAITSGVFEEVMVSTESPTIADLARLHGASVPFLRPLELASDTAQLVDVCTHVLDDYAKRRIFFENFCILWATAPMRTDKDIRAAYQLLDSNTEAVVGVSEYDLPVFCALRQDEEGFMIPIFEEYQKLPSSRQPTVVADNSTMCWVRVSAFYQHGTWLPPKLKGYWMPKYCASDINTAEDWELAEYYYERKILRNEK